MGVWIFTANRFATGFRGGAGQKNGDGYIFDADAWVELAYPGEETRYFFDNATGDKIYYQAKFTRAGLEKMVKKFNAEKEKNPDFELLVNVDHKVLVAGSTTEAAAWICDLRITDEDRLEGKFRWTSLGAELAQGGVYRFISVEVECEEIPQSDWPEKGAVWDYLCGAAITNDHALRDLKPFAYRAEEIEKKQKQNPKGKEMEAIKTLLGLEADATEDQVLEAIKALQSQIETYTAEKEEEELEKQAEAFSKKFGERFKDDASARAFYRELGDKAEAIASTLKVVKAEARKPVGHRNAGTPPQMKDTSDIGIYRKYREMPEGEEKAEFLRANAAAINRGANAASAEEEE